jgi:hypothetical protein
MKSHKKLIFFENHFRGEDFLADTGSERQKFLGIDRVGQ